MANREIIRLRTGECVRRVVRDIDKMILCDGRQWGTITHHGKVEEVWRKRGSVGEWRIGEEQQQKSLLQQEQELLDSGVPEEHLNQMYPQIGNGHPDSCLCYSCAPGEYESHDEPVAKKPKSLHWLVVGYVSPAAKTLIEALGGQVIHLSDWPSLIAVGIAYDPKGGYIDGEYCSGVEYILDGIQEGSTGLKLQFDNSKHPYCAEYGSCDENYLILPGEQYDAEKKEAVPLEPITVPVTGELGDHPF